MSKSASLKSPALSRGAAALSIKSRDQITIEAAVPCHMLVLMAEAVAKAGYELRADVMSYLNLAAIAPLQGLDEFSITRIATTIDQHATGLLHDLSPDDPREGLAVCAQFVLLLLEEGRTTDPRNQSVLASLLIVEDLKTDGSEYPWDEARYTLKAKQLLFRANLLGLYTKRAAKS